MLILSFFQDLLKFSRILKNGSSFGIWNLNDTA